MACLLAATALLLLAGCRADMQNQPYQRPLQESEFYADKRSARPLVEGVVARGDQRADAYFYTGKIGKDDGNLHAVSGHGGSDGARTTALQHLLLAVPRRSG